VVRTLYVSTDARIRPAASGWNEGLHPRHQRVRIAGLWGAWLASRTALYLLATDPRLAGDMGLYKEWYTCCLSKGSFPLSDPKWQYPPGAALVIWLPGHIPGNYFDNFAFLTIACDLAVMLMLCRSARRGGSLTGAWYWVCGVPLLGAISVGRFDMVTVALTVAAALVVTDRGPVGGTVRGALIGVAAAIKVWPVTALTGVPPGQWRRSVTAAVAVILGVWAIFPRQMASFLAHQYTRGIEIESVAATPFMVWRLAGWNGRIVFSFGSWQLSGDYVGLAQYATKLALVVVGMLVLAWWLLLVTGRIGWRPEFRTDAPLAATLLFLLASQVLSPQYMLWVIGLAAACLATGQTAQRPAALAVLAAAGLTQLNFPFGWGSLVNGSAVLTSVLVARNVLLVVATVLAVRAVARDVLP
jgi:Glycosyltransferase family 87